VGGVERCQGSAAAAGGQCAGVAVGKHTLARLEQLQAVSADGLAEADILGQDGQSFVQELLLQGWHWHAVGGEAVQAALQGPGEVHGGRSGGVQEGGGVL